MFFTVGFFVEDLHVGIDNRTERAAVAVIHAADDVDFNKIVQELEYKFSSLK